MAGRGEAAGVRDSQLRGDPPRTRTARQVDVLAAFVGAGGSVTIAVAQLGVRPSTAKRHLADFRAVRHTGAPLHVLRQAGFDAIWVPNDVSQSVLDEANREGWLVVPSLEPR